MKKNILFLILSVFVVTIKAASHKELCSINALESRAGLYAETRGDNRPLDEKMNALSQKAAMNFKDVKLTLLDPKVISFSESDPHKSIQPLKLKKDGSVIALRAILIDKKEMDKSIQGLLLALFDPAESFMSTIEQQAHHEKVYFKVSGLYGYGAKFMEFYFAVPSKEIISDFGLQSQFEKIESIGKNGQSSFSWIKYAAIPFGLLAVLSVWYFKYKR